MPLESKLLGKARTNYERVTKLENDVEAAKQSYREAIRALYVAGGSVREIADALNLSHQRIHQIVKEAGSSWPSLLGIFNKGRKRAKLKCNFCHATQDEVPSLISGPQVYICGICIALARRVVENGETATESQRRLEPIERSTQSRCTFCGKPSKSGEPLVSGKSARICTQCLDICDNILAEHGL